jgi:hypothetical protein
VLGFGFYLLSLFEDNGDKDREELRIVKESESSLNESVWILKNF